MVMSTLTALGAPLLTRFALNRAEKHGFLPARHYLRRALLLLQENHVAEAFPLLQQAMRGPHPPLQALAAVDLALMKLDTHLAGLEREAQEARDRVQAIEREFADTYRRTTQRLADRLYVWGPAVWSILWLGGLIGMAVVLAAHYVALPLELGGLAGAAALGVLGHYEKILATRRQRVARQRRRRLQRQAGYLLERLQQTKAAYSAIQEQQASIAEWRQRFADLLETQSGEAPSRRCGQAAGYIDRIKRHVQTQIVRFGRRNSTLPQK
ncbi:MAG: hypothetical protein Q9P14_13130 [candidate division KSB1 bacterium]|nr:hypothetical protein [candidate division KSB1 bacterium]MDQ7065810.1 hypothetical protein [candidate division KSB1 bacterium]